VSKFGAAARSLPGRLAAFVIGIGAVALIVRGIGVSLVGEALVNAAPYFPLILVLEACVVACSVRALRTLYGDAAQRVPVKAFVRAGLVGYAVAGIVPAGSAAGDATRAALLARYVGAGRAGGAAARMHAVALVANGIISVPCGLAAAFATGASWLVLAIAINAAVCLALGLGLLAIATRGRIGAWLGRRWRRATEFGAELDASMVGERVVPYRAIAWEMLGRCAQVAQNGVLVLCVGGALGLVPALCSEGIHLVAAMVGYIVPANLGATEGNYTLAGSALGLATASAVSIALLAHLAQLAWVIVGSIVLLARPVASSSPAPLQREA
jgi:hypothetical protein